MEKDYDIVVIGTGTADRTFVDKVVPSGLKIAMVESRKYGGISPPGGCDLKKYSQISPRSQTGIID